MAQEKKKEKKFLDQIFQAFSFKNQCCGTRGGSEQLDGKLDAQDNDSLLNLKHNTLQKARSWEMAPEEPQS